MELSKNDTKMTKGLAIMFMVLLHLFCVKTDLPFEPLIYIRRLLRGYLLLLQRICTLPYQRIKTVTI